MCYVRFRQLTDMILYIIFSFLLWKLVPGTIQLTHHITGKNNGQCLLNDELTVFFLSWHYDSVCFEFSSLTG